MSKTAPFHIGTSDWNYKHWRGRFYPEKLPTSQWFEHYAETFDTVEINNTFYQFPAPKGVRGKTSARETTTVAKL
jgi:uncharacterized protein YecE (DUF72 family)